MENNSHIIPVLIGDPFNSRLASNILLNEHNIFVQHINYPTVPKGTERLRITPNPYHTDDMIKDLINSLSKVLVKISSTTAA